MVVGVGVVVVVAVVVLVNLLRIFLTQYQYRLGTQLAFPDYPSAEGKNAVYLSGTGTGLRRLNTKFSSFVFSNVARSHISTMLTC